MVWEFMRSEFMGWRLGVAGFRLQVTFSETRTDAVSNLKYQISNSL